MRQIDRLSTHNRLRHLLTHDWIEGGPKPLVRFYDTAMRNEEIGISVTEWRSADDNEPEKPELTIYVDLKKYDIVVVDPEGYSHFMKEAE